MTSTSRVAVLNPLPVVLRHYALEMEDVFAATGVESYQLPFAGLEAMKKLDAVRSLRNVYGRACSWPTVVTWPTLGHLEPLLTAGQAGDAAVGVIVHDPRPLQKQFGLGRVATGIARTLAPLTAKRVRLLVHSRPAQQVLEQAGLQVALQLPHPVRRPVERPTTATIKGDPYVLVCGQYKPARDVGLLSELGPLIRDSGFVPLLAGRGWPTLEGWVQQSGFLSEADLEELIENASAVLITYKWYFQSGIALRAMEMGTPVVAVRHPFLEDAFGPDYDGLVERDGRAADWQARIALANVLREQTLAAHEAYWLRTVTAWGNAHTSNFAV